MKKYLKVKELNEAVAEKRTSQDCECCGQHFYGSPLARDSHFKIYPSHFSGKTNVSGKEEAVKVDLQPKISRAKKQPKGNVMR